MGLRMGLRILLNVETHQMSGGGRGILTRRSNVSITDRFFCTAERSMIVHAGETSTVVHAGGTSVFVELVNRRCNSCTLVRRRSPRGFRSCTPCQISTTVSLLHYG